MGVDGEKAEVAMTRARSMIEMKVERAMIDFVFGAKLRKCTK
jgi:hypothetical protein